MPTFAIASQGNDLNRSTRPARPRRGGFPANRVFEIGKIIDLITAV